MSVPITHTAKNFFNVGFQNLLHERTLTLLFKIIISKTASTNSDTPALSASPPTADGDEFLVVNHIPSSDQNEEVNVLVWLRSVVMSGLQS